MKEATGELNMTVVTLVAISAIAALFTLVVWPIIQKMLIDNTCQTYGEQWSAHQDKNDVWWCCPGKYNASGKLTPYTGNPTAGNGCFKAE